MLNFFSPNDPNYFIYVTKVVKKPDGQGFEFTPIYKKDQKTADELNNQLGNFCFPFSNLPIQPTERQTFSFAFTDIKKNYLYCFVHSREDNGIRAAYTVVSKYFHPSLFCEVATTVGELFTKNPSDAENYLSNLMHLQLIRRPHDWSFTIKAGFDIHNFDHLSPDNEISKLLNFLFSRFSVNDILSTIVAILLDCRIIVISENIELLGKTVFAILALIHPLSWQGTFIPLLPEIATTALEAPFGYLIGVHSSFASLLLQDSVDKYFVLNVDCHYSVVIGMDDYQADINDLIDTWSDKIRKKLNQYKPIFPKHSVQKRVRKFILSIFQVAYDGCDVSGPMQLFKSFSSFRDLTSDDFKVIISQTQFVDVFMRQITQDFDEDRDKEQQKAESLEILKAFWPNNDFSKTQPERRRRGTRRTPLARVPSKLRENKAKAVEIQPKTVAPQAQTPTQFLSLMPDTLDINPHNLFQLEESESSRKEEVEKTSDQ